MLGHVLPSDREIDWRKMSKTTMDYYLTAQHMDLKIAAMKLWSEALMTAYVKAGGTFPVPAEPLSADSDIRPSGKPPSRRSTSSLRSGTTC